MTGRFLLAPAAVLATLAVTATLTDGPAGLARHPDAVAAPPLVTPIDPQRWQDQQDMTWSDYHPIPGVDWADPSRQPGRALRVALVAIDFPDQPFVITLPKGSDPFGNPQIDPVPRERVPQFYADFFGRPGAVNHGHTINGFWMEQTRGKVGIPKIDAFGPYRMPRNLFEYGLNEWGQEGGCPSGFTCNSRMEPDADALWAKDAGADIKKNYDIILRIYAGYDETGVWQEFGEMKFRSKDDIPAEWGNPDVTKPRWLVTRYVPWTTWKAGAQQWGLSSVRQGENSGTITHEIAHLTFRDRRQQQQPVRAAVPARRLGAVGPDGPRIVQWAGRAAPALGRAGGRRRVHAGRADAAQPDAAEVRHAGPGAAAEPRRPGAHGTRRRHGRGARRRTPAGHCSPASA